jgi:hypothetical protein
MLALVIVLLLAAGAGAVVAIIASKNGTGVSVPPASGVSLGGRQIPPASRGASVGGPKILPTSQVVSFARMAAGPIYWAGPPGPGSELEVTDTGTGTVFIRYLFGGAAAGDPRAIFTTVRTYRLMHAYRVVYADGAATGARRVNVPGGGIAVMSTKARDIYYVAFRHENYIAELYAESPAHALRLLLSGAVRPVRAEHR